MENDQNPDKSTAGGQDKVKPTPERKPSGLDLDQLLEEIMDQVDDGAAGGIFIPFAGRPPLSIQTVCCTYSYAAYGG